MVYASGNGKAKHGKAVVKGKNLLKGSAQPPRMTPDEKRVIRSMHFDNQTTPSDIAKSVGRDLSRVCCLFAQKKIPKPVGQPVEFTAPMVDKTIGV